MASKNTLNRSISFDKEIFQDMEDRRKKLKMDRSEYVKRCILKDLSAGGPMSLPELPDERPASKRKSGRG